MIVEQILGNIHAINHKHLKIDKVQMQWFDTRKKIALLQSESGQNLSMKLTKVPKYGLEDGDILFQDTQKAIVIAIVPTWTLCMWVQDWRSMIRLCYEIGNLHIPLFFGKQNTQLQAPFEKPLQRVLEKLGIAFEKQLCVLDAKNRIQLTSLFIPREPKLIQSPNLTISIAKKG